MSLRKPLLPFLSSEAHMPSGRMPFHFQFLQNDSAFGALSHYLLDRFVHGNWSIFRFCKATVKLRCCVNKCLPVTSITLHNKRLYSEGQNNISGETEFALSLLEVLKCVFSSAWLSLQFSSPLCNCGLRDQWIRLLRSDLRSYNAPPYSLLTAWQPVVSINLTPTPTKIRTECDVAR